MTSPNSVSRRAVLAGALCATQLAAAQVKKDSLRWAQFADTGSPLARMSVDLHLGGKLALDEVNGRGGLYGRKLETETFETGGEPARMGEALQQIKTRTDLFGLWSIVGTQQALMAMQTLPGWPIFGAMTGADPVRRAAPPNAIFVRASWGAEVDRLLAVSKTIGMTRVAVVYPEGTVGQVVQAMVDPLAKKHGMTIAPLATIPNPASRDVGPAAAKVAASNAQLVVVALTLPAIDFILEARRLGYTGGIYTLSDAVGPEFMDRLKDRIRGIGFSSPIPNPWGRNMLIVREYQDAMTRAKRQPKDYSFGTLEGYLNGRVMIEVLKRVGPDVTRERFISAARELKIADLGGLSVDLTRGGAALSFSDVYVLSRTGRVLS